MIINDKFGYMRKNFKKICKASVQEDMHLLAKS